jgi:hypothetical protein
MGSVRCRRSGELAMTDFFHQIVSIGFPFNAIVLMALIGCGAGVLGTIATQLRRFACHRQDINFKRELVDRGLSAEEIDLIVRSQPREVKDEVKK